MRVISRRANESLVIGEKTHITVIKVYEDHVRLAISSPQQQPSFWEADVYLKDSQDGTPTSSQWWDNTFRGLPRFDSLR